MFDIMNTMEFQVNQKIGVLYYNHKTDGKAEIEEIQKISPNGYVTLKNGKRYTPKGKEISPFGDPTYLCSVETAQEIINKSLVRQQKQEEKYQAYLASPEGKRNAAVNEAVKATIQALNKHGWYADIDGQMDVMESEIEQIITKYLSEHEPIN
ncbi:hypothetical protein H6G80_32875 [Nostoc sp. FACHB-87]|uniref:hypothetical protein n=1 Tax=Nostocaceae TaxID=1162 RepID=UPI001682E892|nr:MULTISPECIES: hypothetical protein [Nostocaceae]MBD2458839.1 hypothetical protein [Nostoc sp. FACHB-87]MBD2479856.1 hypothetical protein [Anabaena sp. FACHB-83]